MIRDIPLTPEQGAFAAKNHGLVLKFLNQYHLSEDTYYDVVIFGYLRAVKRYCTGIHLRRYKFSTIAWSCMRTDLINHQKALTAGKRNAEVLSIHTDLFINGLPLKYSVLYGHDAMAELEAKLVLHELSGKLTRQQMQMVRLRSEGYSIREIARYHKVTMKCVRLALEIACNALKQLCYDNI